MNVLSTPTVLFKRVFPVFWMLICAISLAAPLAAGVVARMPIVLLTPLLMAVAGYVVFWHWIRLLADEVKDGGHYLLVRRGEVEDRVELANVVNVSASRFSNPPLITLRLRKPGRFGGQITFIPRRTGFVRNPFARNPIAEDLIARIDRARLESR